MALTWPVTLVWDDPLRNSCEDWSFAVHVHALVDAYCTGRVNGAFCFLSEFRLALSGAIYGTAYLDSVRDVTQFDGFSAYGFMLVVVRYA